MPDYIMWNFGEISYKDHVENSINALVEIFLLMIHKHPKATGSRHFSDAEMERIKVKIQIQLTDMLKHEIKDGFSPAEANKIDEMIEGRLRTGMKPIDDGYGRF